ncbi:MAG: TIR domain-containing protein [Henriciella sp.]|nr:TIR domain-containing protein [Henriciella sp.]
MSDSSEPQPDQRNIRVFVSYSRSQVEFVDDLEFLLRREGFDVLLDRRDIPKGHPDFVSKLRELILDCDTFVFVLSEASARSDTCRWEIDTANTLQKRILVVASDAVPDDVELPTQIKEIDWVHCWRNPKLPGSSQMRGFAELSEALSTDVNWLRDRTDYQVLAIKWESRGSANDSPLLLKKELLREAETWLENSAEYESVPQLVRRFIEASHRHEVALDDENNKRNLERQAALLEATEAKKRVSEIELLVAALGYYVPNGGVRTSKSVEWLSLWYDSMTSGLSLLVCIYWRWYFTDGHPENHFVVAFAAAVAFSTCVILMFRMNKIHKMKWGSLDLGSARRIIAAMLFSALLFFPMLILSNRFIGFPRMALVYVFFLWAVFVFVPRLAMRFREVNHSHNAETEWS